MLFFFFFINLFFYSYSINWKAINLKNQTVYEFDSEHAPPSTIGRLRINVTNIDQENSSNDPLIVYMVRLRWKTPLRWNEDTENKTYDTICELQDHLQDKGVTIIDRSVPSDVNGLDERFSLPSSLFSLICAVRPRNARYAASWTYSKLVTIDSSLRKDDEKENATTMVTGETEDDEPNDANPLTEVTIMKEHIATINDRPFLDSDNSDETGMRDEDAKKSLLDLLRMSRLTLIEDGQPIRTRPTNLTIQVKPDITEDRPPLFTQKLQLQVGKSSEVITRLLMKTDASVESNTSTSSELETTSTNSTVEDEPDKDSHESVLPQEDSEDMDVENSTTTVPETPLFTEEEVQLEDNATISNPIELLANEPEGEGSELLLLQTDGTDVAIEGGGASSEGFEGVNETAFAFESKIFENIDDDMITGKPLDLEDEAENSEPEKNFEVLIEPSDFLHNNASDMGDNLSFEALMTSSEDDQKNVDDQTASLSNATVDEVKQNPSLSEEKDVLFSIPRSEFRQPTADEITDSKEEVEKKTTIAEVLSDYDTLETELRAAIGADEENLERLKQLFSGGFPEGLLRVI